MPKLTVFFIRNGETVLETDEEDALRLSQKIDPPLTPRGYQQAQTVALHLIDELCEQTPEPSDRGDSDDDGVIDPLRNMAIFSAPLKSCQGTALLFTAAGMASQDKLTWRYTTIEAAKSPSAVPVITVNDLAQTDFIRDCGGVPTTVQAGVLHTAAEPWNDGRNKCAFAKVLTKEFKEETEFVKLWKEDRHVHPPRRVLAVQYLRLQDEEDPWSLQELTPKINVTVDLLEPNKYLTPPRKGTLKLKLQDEAPPEPQISDIVQQCVWKARQVGCDTVVFTVPSAVLEDMMKAAGETGEPIVQSCSVLTLLANVNDETATMDWELVDLSTTPHVPLFPGPVDCIVEPPPDKDPSTVPANQWSRFPPPEPEVIPPDYPDLPPFGTALSHPSPPVNLTPEELAPPVRRDSQGRGPRPHGGQAGRGGRGGGRAGRSPTARGGRVPASPAGRTRLPTSPGRAPMSPGRVPMSPGRRTPTSPGRALHSPGRTIPSSPGRVPPSPVRRAQMSPGNAPSSSTSPAGSSQGKAPVSPAPSHNPPVSPVETPASPVNAPASPASSHGESGGENIPPEASLETNPAPESSENEAKVSPGPGTKLPKSTKSNKKKKKKKKAKVALR